MELFRAQKNGADTEPDFQVCEDAVVRVVFSFQGLRRPWGIDQRYWTQRKTHA